jgi:hypothetical protein
VHTRKRDTVTTTLGEGIFFHAAKLVAWPHIWAFLIDDGFLGADHNPEALTLSSAPITVNGGFLVVRV